MKKEIAIIGVVLLLSISFVSAGWFSDMITGGVVKKAKEPVIKCSTDKPCSFGRTCMQDIAGNAKCKYSRFAGKNWKPLIETSCTMGGPGGRICYENGVEKGRPYCQFPTHPGPGIPNSELFIWQCDENKKHCEEKYAACSYTSGGWASRTVKSWTNLEEYYSSTDLLMACHNASDYSEEEKEAQINFIQYNHLQFGDLFNGKPAPFTKEEAEAIVNDKQAFCFPTARKKKDICYSGWQADKKSSEISGKKPAKSVCTGDKKSYYQQTENYALKEKWPLMLCVNKEPKINCPDGTVCENKEKKAGDCKKYIEAECVKMAGVTIPDTATTEICIPETETTAISMPQT